MIPTVEELNAGQLPEAVCLICLSPVPLKENTKIVMAHRADKHAIVACRGSGYVGEQSDGRNEVRRTAIQMRHELSPIIAEKRAELIDGLTGKHWAVATAVDFHAEPLVRMETQAHIWHELALHGDLAVSLREALSTVTRGTTGGLHFADIDKCIVAGHRDWLTRARTMLLAMVEAVPATATDLLTSWLMLG